MPDDDQRHTESERLAAMGGGAPETIRDPTPPAMGAPALPSTIGRFRIDGALGSGGMADVFRAYDPLLHRAVALKVLRTKNASQRKRRLLREARAAAALTHPNTVTIFEVGEADDEVFIAMELLSGSTLRPMIARAFDIPFGKKLEWLLQTARALHAAHERGLVHRDVKPDNIFLCDDGTLKLLDFGIAKQSDDDGDDAPHTLLSAGDPSSAQATHGPSSLRTAAGRRVGTPRYMAPEQHAGEGTDPRTDEYAWALVAFELLIGMHPAAALPTITQPRAANRPADRSDDDEDAKARGRVQVLVSRVPELAMRIEIANAIASALSDRKDDRFPSMAPIVHLLERELAHGAQAPRPMSPYAPVHPSAAPAAPPRPTSHRGIVGPLRALAVLAGAFALIAILQARRIATRHPAPSPFPSAPPPEVCAKIYGSCRMAVVCNEYGGMGMADPSRAACSALNGTWTDGPCNHARATLGCRTETNTLGSCSTGTTWFYTPMTPAEAAKACTPPSVVVSP